MSGARNLGIEVNITGIPIEEINKIYSRRCFRQSQSEYPIPIRLKIARGYQVILSKT